MQSIRTFVVAVAVLVGTAIGSVGFAAQAPQAEEKSKKPDETPFAIAETVEVTATRSALDAEKTPVSTTVVPRADIESRNIRYFDQALTLVEGVQSYRTRGIGDTDFGVGMRGFSSRSSANQSRLLILLDGQPINNSYTGQVGWATLPISEVDRVEVVRGPFSSLYGGNAMAGVINVITRPVDKRSVEFTGQYGSQNTGTYAARYSDRFFGRLGLTFGYDQLHTDGYPAQEVLKTATNSTPAGGTQVTGVVMYPTATGGVNYSVGQRGDNFFNTRAFRARGEYAIDASTFASLQYIRQAFDAGWQGYTTTVRDAAGNAIDNGNVVFQDNGVWKRTTLAPQNYLGAPIGATSNTYQGQLLRSTSSRGQLRVQGGMIEAPANSFTSPGATATLAGGPGTYTNTRSKGAYASAQWSGLVRPKHTFTAGADARHDDARNAVAQAPNYLERGSTAVPDSFAAGKTFNQAAYVQDQIAISDALQITAGGRYDYWRTFDGTNQTSVAAGAKTYPSRSTSSGTAKVAAVYRAAAGTVVRGSVGNAFRNPSVYELYANTRLSTGLQLLANPNVDPERMVSWEGGVRQTVGKRANVDVAYFDNRVTDLIYRVTDFAADPTGNLRYLTNAAEGRTRGVELTGLQRPVPALTLRETYTYTNAIISSNPALPDTEGKDVPYVPRHATSVSATIAQGPLTIAATGRHQSTVFTVDTNTDVVRGVPGSYNAFFEANLSVNYKLASKATVYVNCDNLLDNKYYMFYINPGRLVLAGVRLRY